jgi:hypothetical protein
MPISPKQFYVAERSPSFADRAEFQRNWRGHGKLAMEQPLWDNIFRYTQGDSLDLTGDVAARVPNLDAAADGVSTIWFYDFESLLAIGESPDHPILLVDEARIFAEMVAVVSMFTEEDILFEDSRPGAKLVLFLTPRDGLARPEFEREWRAHAERLDSLEELRGHLVAYRLNYERPLPPSATEGAPPSSLAAFAGVCEIGFADAGALADAVRESQFEDMLGGLGEFATAGRVLATDELLLDGE